MALIISRKNITTIEKSLLYVLRTDSSGYFSNKGHINEPRVVAENVQEICKKNFKSCFSAGIISEDRSMGLSRRAMADIEVIDVENNHYYIDVKTHNIGTSFNMPNITSIERLSKYYSRLNTNFYYLILFVKYEITSKGVLFKSVNLFPIESISWDCLQIQALGKGQIQIKNSNKITLLKTYSRKQWMQEFYCRVLEYYDNAVQKAKNQKEIMQIRSDEWKDN